MRFDCSEFKEIADKIQNLNLFQMKGGIEQQLEDITTLSF